LDIISAIFLEKIDSGTHRLAKNSVGEKGISYIDARKKGSGIPFRLASFLQERRSVAKLPLDIIQYHTKEATS
jgi:hypothetical protein